MESIIEKLIDQLNTSVFVLLVLMAAVGYVLVKAGQWSANFKHHHSRIDGLEGMSEKVIAISTKVDLIYGLVNPNSMTRAFSPISLTEIGEQTAISINAEGLLNKYYARLKKLVDKSDPQNAYDIQNISMSIAKEKLIEFMTAKEINTIKDSAYQKGVIIEDILSILGVMLRNKILNEREIPVSDVDLHTPQA